uniref:Uncharacterized protein n=1 Tax=Rhizophora mucronata TaxID=61149 RepID=A0A2P2JUP0_RHIMU
MMGYGYYGNGGSSASLSSYSSSNLSALAAPFSVDRTSRTHLDVADSTESIYATVSNNPSLHNWLQPHPPVSGADLSPACGAYGYSPSTPLLPSVPYNPLASSSTDAISCGQSLSGPVDAKLCGPSYASPPVVGDGSYAVPCHFGYDLLSSRSSVGSTYNDYSQSVSALAANLSTAWRGSEDCQQGQLDGSFSPKESYGDHGLYASEGMTNYENAPCGIDVVARQKHFKSARTGQLDSENLLVENPRLMPIDYPMISNLESTSVSPQAYPQVQLEGVNSKKLQMLSGTPHERCSTSSDTTSEDGTSAVKSPAVIISYPRPDMCSFTNNTGNDGLDEGFVGPNPSTVKEPHPCISSKGKLCFDAIHVGQPELEQNDNLFAAIASSQNEKLPYNKNIYNDDLDPVFAEKQSTQSPYISPYGFNLTVRKEAINAVENFAEGVDYFNPVVDSPCWKGASLSGLYPFEFSEVPSPQNLDKLDSIKASFGKANGNAVHNDKGTWGIFSVPSLMPATGDAVLEAVNDAVKSASLHTTFSYCHGVQVSDDTNEPRKDNTQSNKSLDNHDHMPLGTEQQGLEECKYMPRICAPDAGAAGAEMKTNDDPSDSSSHLTFPATEGVVHSPPSAEEDATSKHTELHHGASMSKVRMMVDGMHNLSELLRFQCLNDTSELEVEDMEALKDVIYNLGSCLLKDKESMEALKDVINNLGSCMLKDKERLTSEKGSLITRRTASVFHGELSKLEEDTNEIRPQMSKESAVNLQSPLECQHIQKEDDNFISNRKDEKTFNFNPVRVGADTGNVDSMTQAIKKILTENFHVEDDSSPQVHLYKNLWLEAEASLCSVNYMARFNRMKIEMEESKSAKAIDPYLASPVLPEKPKFGGCMVDTSAAATDSQITGVLFPDLSTLSTKSNVDDVMTRFHILKSRDDHSSSVNTPAVEKLPSSEISPDVDNVDKSVQKVKVSSKLPISIQDSPLSSKTSPADDLGTSVEAEIHVPKTQDENSVSIGMEGHQSDLQDEAAKSIGEGSSIHEFHLFVKDNPEFESSIIDRLGYRPHARWYDNSTSDWEHILKEELAGQKC